MSEHRTYTRAEVEEKLTALPRCDYAGCSVIAVYPDDGYSFCWQHYLEHRADMHGEPWPRLRSDDLRHLFSPPCGTPSAARAHYRRGEKPCPACADAVRRHTSPHNPDSRRGSWYRPHDEEKTA